ncbi:MAG TPA: sulfate/molybdate ABC transporter ATP-binding protein [Verrucomicrobiae bacterium]|nr:sulfate/molybdate ABC transporter ATP-binding protein [Verrucomicrobiae bacterium]
MAIELTGIVKKFGNFTALDGVSLAARDGEFLALLGPSGSGKTTLLRILAGLDWPDSGSLKLQSQPVDVIRPNDSNVGLVFQHYALFRHMTVFDNVAFGLSVKRGPERMSKSEIRERVLRLLQLVQLGNLQDRYPAQLSGGQRQRVALARALAVEPKLLLLDEPFGALDAKVRKELRRWLRGLHDSMGLTSIFVTHDQEEALELADRVVVMSQGKIEQIGTPAEIYDHPSSPFVYQFIGNSNRFECEVARGQVFISGQSFGGTGDVYPDGPALAFVRPHDLEIRAAGSGFGIPATVRQVFTAGNLLRVELDVQDGKHIVEVELDRSRNIGDLSSGRDVLLMPQRIKLFPRSGAELPAAVPIRRLTQAG